MNSARDMVKRNHSVVQYICHTDVSSTRVDEVSSVIQLLVCIFCGLYANAEAQGQDRQSHGYSKLNPPTIGEAR